jgi:hypothetical protein
MRVFRHIALCLTLAAVASLLVAQKNGVDSEVARDPGNMASTYVPLESWAYPAIERLAAFGYVETAIGGERPWTRMEFARLIEEAGDSDSNQGLDPEAARIYASLKQEFSEELARRDGAANLGATVESMYVRNTGIAGTPITDGYHFGQTLVNNYGRPYGPGENNYSGVALRAVAGSFAVYVRGESQRAGLEPSAPLSSQPLIAAADNYTNGAAAEPESGMERLRLLDAYASYTFKNNQLSVGQQSLWWGPGKGGPVLFSNNAEPVLMIRLDRTSPIELPSIGKWLGKIRFQLFWGRLEGQQFDNDYGGIGVSQTTTNVVGSPGVALADQPFFNGQKFSFKFTRNFEFSVSKTGIYAGPGFPATLKSLLRSVFSAGNSPGAGDPGDRRSAVDVTYRVPWIRDWMTLYFDTFSDDEPFPLEYPKECVWSPGIYLAKLPHLPKADFRMEGFLSPPRYIIPGYYYYNFHYLSGYTNSRELIGSWIGREGRGEQLWTTWWFSPRTSLQASFRNMSADRDFLHGGNLHDFSVTSDISVRPEWSVHVTGQLERWSFPVFASAPQNNFAITTELRYTPAKGHRWWSR